MRRIASLRDVGPHQKLAEYLMIKLTRLDGEQFILNADLIRYVESRPDTFVTLTTGERLVVRESMNEVVDASVRFQQRKHMLPAGFGRENNSISGI